MKQAEGGDVMNWSKLRVGVVVARWNSMVTDEMKDGAILALEAKGVSSEAIHVVSCPGSFEVPLACKWLAERDDVDGVIAIGAVIRGDTPHFDYVCRAVTDGIRELNMQTGKPIAFGILTTDTVQQAMERAGRDRGNKGAEAALALCEMLELKASLSGRLK
ncbi:MAG: 6,7-dimethyl-8-ribityllumazine synthase [Balneolaceae bacterium]